MTVRTAAAALLAASAIAFPAVAADKAALIAEGKGLIKSFAGTLKGELSSAMKSGGPVAAIGVCNQRAPEIAYDMSEASGWSVARSSHRLRNPANEADAYTAAVIEDFLTREAAGEKAGDLVRAEIVEEDGGKVFHLVKAIPTGKVCVACHGGDEVSPEVEAKLADLYPDDQARGFRPGQMRGVFTLSKRLE